jgi:hypothetical protein
MGHGMNAKTKALAAALAGVTPDQQRQREFIVEYFDNMKEAMLKRVADMPAEWDGHEIRLLAYESAARNVSSLMKDRRSKRVRNFESHCLTKNLF